MTDDFILATDACCQVHGWPTRGMAKRLVARIRRSKQLGPLIACRDCIRRAKGVYDHLPRSIHPGDETFETFVEIAPTEEVVRQIADFVMTYDDSGDDPMAALAAEIRKRWG